MVELSGGWISFWFFFPLIIFMLCTQAMGVIGDSEKQTKTENIIGHICGAYFAFYLLIYLPAISICAVLGI